MYSYKSLNNISYHDITKSLNLAFSDYYLPIQLSENEVQTRFKMSGVNKELSYGAFLGNQMVGFIFNSCNIYNNHKAVFDVATGVIPEHRGNQVFTNLFKYAEKNLQKYEIEKYYLEVLQQNDKAISLYKNQGFTVTREFSILKASSYTKGTVNEGVEYIEFNNFDLNQISHCNCVNPSYEHSINILKINPNFYSVSYKQKNDKITAFCIFSKQDGRIIQLGYTDLFQLKIIVEHLLSKFENISVKNIDVIYSEVLSMFHSLGFNEVTKQFEMVKTI